ncbi:MAG: leucine-rich repeat domain-containing protein [Planctomycetota bacterium]|jgi:hypothetical protein
MLRMSHSFAPALVALIAVVGCDMKGAKPGSPASAPSPSTADRNARLVEMGIATRDTQGNVVELDLRGVENISDDSLKDVAMMDHLQVLHLSGRFITPVSLHHFEGSHLRRIVLEGTSIPPDHPLVGELKKNRPPGFVLEFRESDADPSKGTGAAPPSEEE